MESEESEEESEESSESEEDSDGGSDEDAAALQEKIRLEMLHKKMQKERDSYANDIPRPKADEKSSEDEKKVAVKKGKMKRKLNFNKAMAKKGDEESDIFDKAEDLSESDASERAKKRLRNSNMKKSVKSSVRKSQSQFSSKKGNTTKSKRFL